MSQKYKISAQNSKSPCQQSQYLCLVDGLFAKLVGKRSLFLILLSLQILAQVEAGLIPLLGWRPFLESAVLGFHPLGKLFPLHNNQISQNSPLQYSQQHMYQIQVLLKKAQFEKSFPTGKIQVILASPTKTTKIAHFPLIRQGKASFYDQKLIISCSQEELKGQFRLLVSTFKMNEVRKIGQIIVMGQQIQEKLQKFESIVQSQCKQTQVKLTYEARYRFAPKIQQIFSQHNQEEQLPHVTPSPDRQFIKIQQSQTHSSQISNDKPVQIKANAKDLQKKAQKLQNQKLITQKACIQLKSQLNQGKQDDPLACSQNALQDSQQINQLINEGISKLQEQQQNNNSPLIEHEPIKQIIQQYTAPTDSAPQPQQQKFSPEAERPLNSHNQILLMPRADYTPIQIEECTYERPQQNHLIVQPQQSGLDSPQKDQVSADEIINRQEADQFKKKEDFGEEITYRDINQIKQVDKHDKKSQQIVPQRDSQPRQVYFSPGQSKNAFIGSQDLKASYESSPDYNPDSTAFYQQNQLNNQPVYQRFYKLNQRQDQYPPKQQHYTPPQFQQSLFSYQSTCNQMAPQNQPKAISIPQQKINSLFKKNLLQKEKQLKESQDSSCHYAIVFIMFFFLGYLAAASIKY